VKYLQRHLSDEFELSVAYRGEPFEESEYDLIYPLEFMLIDADRIGDPRKYITGIRSFLSWADWDFLSLVNYLSESFLAVHTVSRELYYIFSPYLPTITQLTHGVDLELFSPKKPSNKVPGSLRLGWAGNRATFIKGFYRYIEPLTQLPGIQLSLCGYSDRNLALEEMPDFYESIDAYICTSSFEGSNNTLLEASAMERAIVTTSVGTVPEFLEDRVSALIVDRDLDQIKNAVIELRDNPNLRRELGKNARASLVTKKWDWMNKSEEYRRFFRAALKDDNRHSYPSHKSESQQQADDHHLLNILQRQNALLRELRQGDAIEIYDLTEYTKRLEQEIKDIRTSKLYKLVQILNNNKAAQAIISAYNKMKS
jgi:glycosyltransferase involved in cell wall biosynthesis